MVDYSTSVVYKIFCNDKNILDFYIGSTRNFTMRKKYHINTSKNSNLKLYDIIRENGGWDKWTMELIEEYPCTCREELVIRERYWYDELKPTLNINRPFTSYEEEKKKWKDYRENNKEKIHQYKKQYREANRESNKEYMSKYMEANRESIKQQRREHYEANKESIKKKSREYREANRESIKQQRREYYKANKESISQQKKEYREANKESINQKRRKNKNIE
jgi:hypothetical protein